MRKTWTLGIALLGAAPAHAWTAVHPSWPANFSVTVTQPATVDAVGGIEVPVTIQIRSVASSAPHVPFAVSVTLVITLDNDEGFDAPNDGGFTCDSPDGIHITCTGTMVEGQTVTFRQTYVPYQAYDGYCPPGDASTEATVTVNVPEGTLADNDATATTHFIHCP